jgi:hypothetical protein
MELAVQGIMEPGLHVGGQLNRLRITENIHGQPGLIDHQLAVSTVLEMAFEFVPGG